MTVSTTAPRSNGLCATASRERAEPLTATASRVDRWLLVEHRGAWGPETVPSRRMGRAVGTALARSANAARARLVLVRRPATRGTADRHGPDTGRAVYAVDSRPGHERVLHRHVADDAELVHLVAPFGEPSPDGWAEVEGPLYLVCTHGRHDRCCALRGRPVAGALARHAAGRTWECTHIGGDRFAANLVVLPDGLYLGRVELDEVVRVVDDLAGGVLPAGRVRGRSSLPLPTQAAQQFAREASGRWGRRRPGAGRAGGRRTGHLADRPRRTGRPAGRGGRLLRPRGRRRAEHPHLRCARGQDHAAVPPGVAGVSRTC